VHFLLCYFFYRSEQSRLGGWIAAF